jgi:hypothetical protein
MATKFVPLTIELISEGDLLKKGNAELRRLQQAMIDFMKEFGKDVKASAKLSIEVSLVRDPKLGDDSVAIIEKIKTTLPARPPGATLAIAGESQTDEPCLLVRTSGSSSDTPKQAVLCTEDGRDVDPETDEIREPAKAAV